MNTFDFDVVELVTIEVICCWRDCVDGSSNSGNIDYRSAPAGEGAIGVDAPLFTDPRAI